MLIIFNCHAIYGTGIPYMMDELRERDFEIAVCGNMDDWDRGEIERAQAVLQTKNFERCAVDNMRSNIAMIMLLMNRHEVEPENTMVVSDIAGDRLAADHHGCAWVPAGAFERHFQLTDGFHHLVKE